MCYAKFFSGGAVHLSEFVDHIGTKWSCVEDTSTNTVKTPKRLLPKSIVFIADCKSVEQLTLDLATMPGGGISNLEIFPLTEVVEY